MACRSSLTQIRNKLLMLGLLALSITTQVGCVSSPWMQAVMDTSMLRMKERQELAQIRAETKTRLAEERTEAARIEAERMRVRLESEAKQHELEQKLCQANQEAQLANVENQLSDKLETDLGLKLTQHFEIGEIVVDQEELKKLLKQRETEAQNAPPTSPQRSSPQRSSCGVDACGCEDMECGCEPGLLKRHCDRCRLRRCNCEPEPDCGGPEALNQLAQRGPKPLRPVDIPLKLTLNQKLDFANPRIEDSRIRTQPILPQTGGPGSSPQYGRCEDGDKCVAQYQDPNPLMNASTRRTLSEEIPVPPKPVVPKEE